jgi:hypothetical protein
VRLQLSAVTEGGSGMNNNEPFPSNNRRVRHRDTHTVGRDL